MHEIMHTLGFKHIHTRLDRDSFVKVQKGLENNINYVRTGYPIGYYDPESIMHYSVKNDKMTSDHSEAYKMGLSKKLSDKDLQGIKFLYEGPYCTYDFSKENYIL